MCTSVSIVWLSISVRGILVSGKLAPLLLGTIFLVAGRPAPFVTRISVLSFFVLSLPVTGPTSSAFSYSNESIATTGIVGSAKSFIRVFSRDGIVNLTSKVLLVYFQSLVHLIFLLDLTSKILLVFLLLITVELFTRRFLVEKLLVKFYYKNILLKFSFVVFYPRVCSGSGMGKRSKTWLVWHNFGL